MHSEMELPMPCVPCSMRSAPRFRLALLALICAAAPAVPAGAQIPDAAPLASRGVDLVALAQGPSYLGSILPSASSDTLQIAVRHAWLADTDPDDAKRQLQAAQQLRAQQLETLRRRIRDWKAERTGNPDLVDFLDDELDRLAAEAHSSEASPEFVAIRVRKSQIRRTYVQPNPRKLVAIHAWARRLKDVETRSVSDLLAELQAIPGFQLQQPVSLADRIATPLESEDAWAARRAVCEYDMLQPLDFQGTADLLVQTSGPGAADNNGVPTVELLGDVLQQLQKDGSALEALLGGIADGTSTKPEVARLNPRGLQQAQKTAEDLKVRGFRVTQVDLDLTRQLTRVRTSFHARDAEGDWRIIWHHEETADGREARPVEEGRIRQDPRVAQLQKLVRTLGLNDHAFTTAIRFGAATSAAQKQADSEFYKFRDRYTRRLNSPPLPRTLPLP